MRVRFVAVNRLCRIATCLLLAGPVLACSSEPTGPEDHVRLGVLALHPGDGSLDLEVERDGLTTTVEFLTWGNGCSSKDRTEVEVDGTVVTIRPYNVEPPCIYASLSHLVHRATFTMERPSAVYLFIHGLSDSHFAREVVHHRIIEVF